MEKLQISAVIIAKNAQDSIQDCLESLINFDEIILLDNESSDNTPQIALEFGKKHGNLKLFSHEFIGFGALKNLAVSYAKHDWIFSIDSDEVLELGALESIQKLAQDSALNSDCMYSFSRKNLYNGEWIKACGWNPDFVKRLFNKNKTRFNDNIVHESLIGADKNIILKGYIAHKAAKNMGEILNKMNLYTNLSAKNLHECGKKTSVLSAILKGIFVFLKDYFFRRGIFYGYKGFVIAFCNGLGSFFKHLKLYELNK